MQYSKGLYRCWVFLEFAGATVVRERNSRNRLCLWLGHALMGECKKQRTDRFHSLSDADRDLTKRSSQVYERMAAAKCPEKNWETYGVEQPSPRSYLGPSIGQNRGNSTEDLQAMITPRTIFLLLLCLPSPISSSTYCGYRGTFLLRWQGTMLTLPKW